MTRTPRWTSKAPGRPPLVHRPTKEVGPKYVAALVFAQFVFFVALLGPAIIGIGVKVQTIVPDDQKAARCGVVVLGVGALFAVIGTWCSAGCRTAPRRGGVVVVRGSWLGTVS